MKNKKPTGTMARSHAQGLTLAQQNAVDLLATGHNDTETAALLSLNRVTVTRWRLYSPEFQAALAVRRADLWCAAGSRFRLLLAKSLGILADALDDATNTDRVTVALAVLKLAGPPPNPPAGSLNPDDYVRDLVEQERQRVRLADVSSDYLFNLPDIEEHENTVRKRLAALSTEKVHCCTAGTNV